MPAIEDDPALGPVAADGYYLRYPYGLKAFYDDLETWPQFAGIRFDWGEPASTQPTSPPRALFVRHTDGQPEGPSDQVTLPTYRAASSREPLEIPGASPAGSVRYAPRLAEDPPVYVSHIVARANQELAIKYDASIRALSVYLATDAQNKVLSIGHDIKRKIEASDEAWRAVEVDGGPGIVRVSRVAKMRPMATRLQGGIVQLYAENDQGLDHLLNLLWAEIKAAYGAVFMPGAPEPMPQQVTQANAGYVWPFYLRVPIFQEIPGVRFLRVRSTIADQRT